VVSSGEQPSPPARPELILAVVARESCRIVDTWQAGGLRGTGSHDVVVESALVAGTHAISFSDAPRLDAPLYRMPFAATLSAGCAAICLGVAGAAIQALIELARVKVKADSGLPLRDRPAVQIELARMKSHHAAARLLLHGAVNQAWGACVRGEPLTMQARAAVWAAAAFAAAQSKNIVRRAYEAAGSSALYVECPLERAHRDIHAIAQHVILDEVWLQEAGRVWLDLEPSLPMFAS
jgi:alkylation response protein AidB-like acyl-CoA dehydrogenase